MRSYAPTSAFQSPFPYSNFSGRYSNPGSFGRSSSPQLTLASRRYHREPFSPYELALSLKPGSYLSHGTAAYLHNLADRELGTVYVNKEQSFKDLPEGTLTQAGIKRAFSNKQRQSGYIITHNLTKIALLNGKHSDRLGVIRMTGSYGEQLELTDLERTLNDIAVRPVYSGGPTSVLEAYRRAQSRTSITRMLIDRWIGHANGNGPALYAKQLLENVPWRTQHVARAGLGFTLPTLLQCASGQDGQVVVMAKQEATTV